MKRTILTIATTLLLSFMGLRAQQCDTIDAFPWMPNLSSLSCWEITGNSMETASNEQVIFCYRGSNAATSYVIITTPHLRLDCDSSGLRLWWKDQRNSSTPNLKVMVLKEDGTRDTLYDANPGTSFTQHSVSLATYVGQTVRIAFEVRPSSVDLRDISIYSQHLPLGTLSVPGMAVVGDSVQAVLSLSQGLSPISYSWHSAMLGDLVAADTLRMVYPSSGWDTLTVTASNAYGTLSRSAKLRVHECPTVATFPWREDFDGYDTASYNVCWTINGWTHRNPGNTIYCYDEDGKYASYSQLMTSSTNGKYMLSPAITIPATGTEHLRLWVQSYNIPTVRISPTASLLPADFTDTLIVGSSTGNTMVWRLFDLAPYAGQTIRVGLFRQGTSPNVNTVQIDYDTLPVIYTEGPAKTATGTSTLLTAHLRHGASEELHYTWTSAVGGIITTNALGDSAWVNYSAGFSSTEDTLTVVATNAFGADTVVKPLHIIDCTPATILPWSENFDDGLACWYRPQGSNFENTLYTSINQVHDSILRVPLRYDTLGSWIMSKEIHLPADTALLPRLFWTVGCSRDNYQTFYSLLVTDSYNWTDTTNYTHLITDSTVHTRSLYGADLMSLDLRPYAGRTIHLAIHNLAGHRSTNTTYLNFHSFEIRTTAMPWVTLESDATEYFFGDTAYFTATFVEGDTNGLTYTWHSSLQDTTTTVNSNLLTLTYTQAGLDTVSVVATNAFGSDTATVVVTSTIINEPTVSLVAEGRQYNKVETDDTVVYLATRNRCVTTGMTYQFHSSLMDTTVTVATTADTMRLPMVYPVAGIDTFTVTLSNIHGTSQPAGLTMEVLDCPAVSVPFYEDFEGMTMNTSPDCWYGYNWYVSNHNGGRAAYSYNTSDMHFLISPAIDLPDSLGLQLSWSYWYNVFQSDPVMILVSPTGGKRPEDFTDTLYNGRSVTNGDNRDSLSLDAYRGSRVRVGFPIYGYANYYDDIRLDYKRTAPQVSLDMPGTINLHDTVLFTATINDCSSQGLSVSWHSTLMGTSLTPIPSSSGVGSEVQLVYAVTGVDTITVIVANAFGADTAVAVVRVIDCSPLAVPYSEDFEGVTATLSSEQGNLADCWDYSWNGSNVAYAPHVIANGGYQYLSNLPSQALFMVAGNSTGYGNQAEVLLPRFADSLQTLSIAFDYHKESANIGTLTVGYYDGDTFTALQTMTPQSQTYRRDTVSFASAIVPDGRIALRWTQANSWYAVAIDNVDVFHTPASFFVPQITIAASASVLLTDSATYSVTLNDRCSPEGLSFTWHSTLLDSTIVTTESILTLGYAAGGIDTVTVIASNAYGADTAVAVVQVIDCSGAAVPYFEDFEGVTAEGWNSAYGNLPECWGNIAIGASHRPKVVDSYQYISNLPNQALLIMAGTYSGYADAAYVLLPLFSDSLQRLSVAFDYRCESASYGTLTVGYWNDSLLTFHPVQNLASHTGNYLRDTVSFDDVASVQHLSHTHIALKWYCNSSFYGVVIDNIEVFRDSSDFAPTGLAVDSVSAHCATLSWQPYTEATAYHVTIGTTVDTMVSGTTVTICGLDEATPYVAGVAPVVAGVIGHHADVSFSTLPYCSSLSGISYEEDGGNLVLTCLFDSTGETTPAEVSIAVTDLTTGSQWQSIGTGDGDTLTGLAAAHNYRIVVTALCNGTAMDNGDTLEFSMPASVCYEVRGPHSESYRFIDAYSYYNYDQMLYPAAAVGSVDTLYGIAFRVTEQNSNRYRTVDIYVGHSMATTLTSPVSAANLTQVADDYTFSIADTGWSRIIFDSPFAYDGTSNLIVTLVDVSGFLAPFSPGTGMHAPQAGEAFLYKSFSSSSVPDPYTLNFTPYTFSWMPDIQLLGGCDYNQCLGPWVTVDSTTTHSISLSWEQRGTESLWQVEYRTESDAPWMVVTTTAATAYTMTGLTPSTTYQFRLASLCSGDIVYGDSLTACTACDTVQLPYHTDFTIEHYPCWNTSGYTWETFLGISLNPNMTQYNHYVVSPAVGTPLNDVTVTVRAMNPNNDSYYSTYDAFYEVGVCDADGSNPVWIDTVGFAQRHVVEEHTFYLHNYTGSARHIIIRPLINSFTLYSVTLDQINGCIPVHEVWVSHLTDTSATAQWEPENSANSHAVYFEGSLLGIAPAGTTAWPLPTLTPSTEYTVAVREICSAGDTSAAISHTFSTACEAVGLPYFEGFGNGSDLGYDQIHGMPDCWTLHDNPYGTSVYYNPELLLYSSGYADSSISNYIISPLLNVGFHGATVSFKAKAGFASIAGFVEVGVMTNVSDTDSFIPCVTVEFINGGAPLQWYQFNTATMALPDVWAVAIRWDRGHQGVFDSLTVTANPVPTYTITLAVNDATMGSVTGAPEAPVIKGTELTISASANEHYQFVNWTDTTSTEVSTEAAYTFIVNADMALTANFEAITYSVTVSVNDTAMGGVTGIPEVPVMEGTELTLIANANEHYQFVNWTDTTGTEVSTEAAYTFTVNADMALTANFEAITYTVTASVNDTAMGSITGIPEIPLMEGTELTLTASANEHYQFVNWTDTTGTEVSTEAAYTFIVNADMALTANFEAITYTVTVDVNDTAMGSVTGGGTYESGSTITIIATPNEGYRFVIWSDSVTTPSREILLTSDTAFKAYFSPANVGIGSTEVVANDIVIRPNPTAGDAYISVGQSSTVTVIDLHGRTVMAPMQVDNTVRIQQGTLPKGIYFVSVSNERGTAVRKLVIE